MIVIRNYHPLRSRNQILTPISYSLKSVADLATLCPGGAYETYSNPAKHLEFLLVISLLMSIGCATPSKQQPTTIGPHCSIAWDKTTDPKVTEYQLSVIDQSKQAKKTVQYIPADTTKLSCKDAGANHEGM